MHASFRSLSISSTLARPALLLLLLLLLLCLSGAFAAYQVIDVRQTVYGVQGHLALQPGTQGPYGGDLETLSFSIEQQTESIVRIRVLDEQQQRWQVPYLNLLPPPTEPISSPLYTFSYTEAPFGFAVVRIADGAVLFNSTPPAVDAPADAAFPALIFEDQFISFGTSFSEVDPDIYGLGERIRALRLDTDGRTYSMWNRDNNNRENIGLYGFHPFYLYVSRQGQAHGVFFLNSNAMDVVVNHTSLTYKTIGGVLDLFVMTGPTPSEVIAQYMRIVGTPHMPPYWALGFHQCRWGYHTVNETRTVVQQFEAHNLPLDTIWNDLDYMDAYRDFTLDPVRFPPDEMRAFLSWLHGRGQHYIPIVDPGLKREPGYFAYDELMASGAYVRDAKGHPFVGEVWPGLTVFPDFSDPRAVDYWILMFTQFYAMAPIDGVWIDMNEISNMCDGECPNVPPIPADSGAPPTGSRSDAVELSARPGTAGFDPNHPPYSPCDGVPLDHVTFAPDAVHSIGLEYNAHPLYGYLESRATQQAIERLRQRRSVVISRSNVAGSGHYAGHWTGDNFSTWPSMRSSIASILNHAMFGIALVGSDICGFQLPSDAELCTRWMQLGTLYPFSRNHNMIGNPPQEPYVYGDNITDIMRASLQRRYQLLPYLYTLFWQASTVGSTVWRPLFFEWPADAQTRAIDEQFMLGAALLVSPVLTAGAFSVNAYLPQGRWFDWDDGTERIGGVYYTLAAPLDKLNVYVRGGWIVPTQGVGRSTVDSRQLPYGLTVAPDEWGRANGTLYLDDGDSLAVGDAYTLLALRAALDRNGGSVSVSATHNGYDGAKAATLGSVRVLGVWGRVYQAAVNGVACTFAFDALHATVLIDTASVPLAAAGDLTVTFSTY